MSLKRYKLENFYSKCPDADKPHRHYPNESLINIKLPARILIAAPSGDGKTNTVCNFMKAVNQWHKVIIVAKNLDEPLYKRVIDKYRALEKKYKCQMLLAINDLDDLPNIDKDFPPDDKIEENTLAIFDDLICEGDKALEILNPWFTRGRKKDVTMCFLSQRYYKVPMMIRTNCNYLILKNIKALDLKRILSEYETDTPHEQVRAKYHQAMKGYEDDGADRKLNAFFMIDPLPPRPELQFRSQFSPV